MYIIHYCSTHGVYIYIYIYIYVPVIEELGEHIPVSSQYWVLLTSKQLYTQGGRGRSEGEKEGGREGWREVGREGTEGRRE